MFDTNFFGHFSAANFPTISPMLFAFFPVPDLQDQRVLLRPEHPRPRHGRSHREEAAKGAGGLGGDRLHEGMLSLVISLRTVNIC